MFPKFQERGNLQPTTFSINGADGHELDVLGEGNMEITIVPLKVIHDVIVTEFQTDAMLGISC